MQSVSVSLLPSILRPQLLPGSIAVVIDVLRATTVMATAIANGADRILPCQTIEEAHRLVQLNRRQSLLCGERGGLPIDGFDLGNSPAEYMPETVSGKSLVMTTTNGTKALAAVNGADDVVTACFLNRSAVLAHVQDAQRVLVCCAGTDGEISREDVLLAGALVASLVESFNFKMADDSTRLALDSWKQVAGDDPTICQLTDALLDSQGGRNLQRIGHADDITLAAQIDTLSIVPTRTNLHPLELRFTSRE
ncbi:MAG: 2-phosphosulfolactate phosphatase [Pirellulaceae bacterium]